jgi:hypothetical protein
MIFKNRKCFLKVKNLIIPIFLLKHVLNKLNTELFLKKSRIYLMTLLVFNNIKEYKYRRIKITTGSYFQRV